MSHTTLATANVCMVGALLAYYCIGTDSINTPVGTFINWNVRQLDDSAKPHNIYNGSSERRALFLINVRLLHLKTVLTAD